MFTLFYALYGSVLYVVGPFVLALIPSRGLGQLGRTYFVNMMVFQCWGLLYAIFQSLMSALQITDPMQFNGSFLQAFVGSSQMIVMSVASVSLSIMIALIPFIASRIVRGYIGSTLMTVISGVVTAGAAASGTGIRWRKRSGCRTAGVVRRPAISSVRWFQCFQSRQRSGQPRSGWRRAGTEFGRRRLTAVQPYATWPSPDGVNVAAVATMSSDCEAPSTVRKFSASRGDNESPSVSAQSASGYHGRSLAGFAAWHAGHAIGRTMRWAGMGAEA